jgi:hypothetical protein
MQLLCAAAVHIEYEPAAAAAMITDDLYCV